MSWVPAPTSTARIVAERSLPPSRLTTVAGIAPVPFIPGREGEFVEQHVGLSGVGPGFLAGQLIKEAGSERANVARFRVARFRRQILEQAGFESAGRLLSPSLRG